MIKEITNHHQIKNLYKQVKNKGEFLIRLGQKVEKSPHTCRMWFSNHPLTSDFPEDKKIMRIVFKELEKSEKK